jgi:O-Antigen ligase
VVRRPRALALSRAAVLATLFVLGWALRVGLPVVDLAGIRFHHEVHSIRASEIIAVLAVLLLIRGRPPGCLRPRGSLATFAASGFMLAGLAAASSLWALHPGLALLQGAHLAIWVAFAIVVAMAQAPPSRMAAAFVLGLLVHVAVGIAQAITQGNIGLWWLGELRIRPAPPWSTITHGEWQFLRVYGLSSHPNVLAGHFAIGLVLCWGLAFGRRPIERVRVVVTWAALFVALLLTFSRSGLLGAVVAMTVSAIWMSRTGVSRSIARLGSGLVVCAAIMIALLVWTLRSHLLAESALIELLRRSAGTTKRFGLMGTALRLLADHPIGGVGARNFSSATRAITPDQTVLDSVHNVPMLIGAELGLAGLVLVGVVVAVLVAVGCRRWSAQSVHLWHGPVAGGLAALALISLLDHYPWSVPQGGLLGAWLAGWWLSEESKDLDDERQRPAQPVPPGSPATRSA